MTDPSSCQSGGDGNSEGCDEIVVDQVASFDGEFEVEDEEEAGSKLKAVDLSKNSSSTCPSFFKPISPQPSGCRSADHSPEPRQPSTGALNRSFSEITPRKIDQDEKTSSPSQGAAAPQLAKRRGRPPRKSSSQQASVARETRSFAAKSSSEKPVVGSVVKALLAEDGRQRFNFRPRKPESSNITSNNNSDIKGSVDNNVKNQRVIDYKPPVRRYTKKSNLDDLASSVKKPELGKDCNQEDTQVVAEKRPKKRPLSPDQRDPVAEGRTMSVNDIFKELRESIIGQGIWIQCSACMKWRHLPPGTDPSLQPVPWYCSMNEDVSYNDCSVEQQVNEEAEEDLISAEFSLGSIVWAKTPGFPWWPAMVDLDPDSYEFYWLEENSIKLTHYNVTYFDEKVSRAWVTTSNIRRFTGDASGKEWTLIGKHQNYTKQRDLAVQEAKAALLLSVEERAAKFGFISHVCKDTNNSAQFIAKLGSAVVSPAPSRDSGVCSSVSPVSSRSSSVQANFSSTNNSSTSNDTSDQPNASKRQKRSGTITTSDSKTVKRRNRSAKNAEEDEEDEEMMLAPPKPMSLTDWLMNGPRPPPQFFEPHQAVKSLMA